MAVKTYGWCRVEGTPIIDKRKLYGEFTNLPANIDVFYGLSNKLNLYSL